jgi:hypothetical protein
MNEILIPNAGLYAARYQLELAEAPANIAFQDRAGDSNAAQWFASLRW